MDVPETARAFGDLFAQVYDHCYRRRSPREFRISAESLALLRHLFDAGPLTVKEAAAHFDRSQAAMSEMIDRLMKRGLLDRIEDERDRRRHFVWLTEPGQELLRVEKRPLSEELLAAAMQRMAAADREDLIRCLRLLVQAASEHATETRRRR